MRLRGQSLQSHPASLGVVPWASAPLLAALAVSPMVDPPTLPLEQVVGQKVVTAFEGTEPSGRLLRRLRTGHLGGVVLFSQNVTSPVQLRRLTKRIRNAAARGGNPPPLVAVDQEGGLVKRLAWAPPRAAAAAMTNPKAEGAATGRALRAAGITVDLAPVADVERRPNFLGSRAFGATEAEVAREACAFSSGLSGAGVTPTLKHFPGLGEALANTDLARVTIRAPLRLAPYRRCARNGLVMISSATYPRLGPSPAVFEANTYALLRDSTVTISDDLTARAMAGRGDIAVRAARAGLDLLLYGGSEETSGGAYRRLLRAVRQGRLGEQRVRASAARIIALKAGASRAHLND
jgi:beta-N-acetylhexosaminidase